VNPWLVLVARELSPFIVLMPTWDTLLHKKCFLFAILAEERNCIITARVKLCNSIQVHHYAANCMFRICTESGTDLGLLSIERQLVKVYGYTRNSLRHPNKS
jgi:hypothetical protein